MSVAIELKKTIDALNNSIDAKKAELSNYFAEKTNLQKEISTIEGTTLPSLRKQKSKLDDDLIKATDSFKKSVDKAYSSAYNEYDKTGASYALKVAQSKWNKEKSDALEDYNEAKETASIWGRRYSDGSKWKGAVGGWQGYYAGDYGRFCTHSKRNTHDYQKDAPSYCLSGSERRKRQEYAKAKSISTLTAKNNAKTVNDNLQSKPNYLISAENNKADAITLYNQIKNVKEPMASIAQAIKDKLAEISSYVATGGTIQKKRQRISFIDSQTASVSNQITNLDREKASNEVNYQKLLADEANKAKIADELAKQEQAKREGEKAILDASIEANLEQVKSGVTSIPSTSKNAGIGIGIAILAIGYFAFKRK